jgi:hypothetical protein
MNLKFLLIGLSATLVVYFIIKCCFRKRKKRYINKRRSIKKHYLNSPSKCFSCEKQIIRTHGLASVNLAQPTKCFDCEKQTKRSQPTKCFDCESSKGNFLTREVIISKPGYGKFFN